MKKLISFIFLVSILIVGHTQTSVFFDGTNDYVQTNYAGVTGRTSRTFESWVKVPSTAPARNLVILDYGRNAVGSRNTFMVDASRGLRFISGGTNANINTSANAVPLNKWVHVAFVLDNGTGYLYIDGEQIATSNLSTVNTQTGGTNLRFGNRVPGGSNLYFNGELDEIRMWGTALTQNEIRDWMCQEVTSSHPEYSNLEGYWKVDAGSGTSVIDSSGNSRNGTINNGVLWKQYGAPVGNKSVQQYGTSLATSLKHTDGDSLSVSNVTGGAKGIHVYYRKNIPNSTNLPTGFSAIDTSRHWGVHIVGGSNSRYNLNYYYQSNSHLQRFGGCSNSFLYRANNATAMWTNSNSNLSNGAFVLTSQPSREFIIAYALSGKPVINSTNGSETVPSCNGDSVTLSNATSGFSYQWLRNGQIMQGDTMSSIKVISQGSYSMILSNGTLCNDTSNSLYVKYFNNPTVSFAPLSSACSNEFSVQMTGGLPSGGKYLSSYSSGNLFVINNSGAGKFKVTYAYTDTNGCSDTASQYLTVNSVPRVSLASKGAVCLDSASHQLIGGTPTGGSYFVNGAQATQFNPRSLGAGVHIIKYTFTDTNKCSGVDSISTVIHDLPTVSLRLVSKRFCEGNEAVGLDGANPNGGIYAGNGVVGFNFDPKISGVGKHPISYTFKDRGTGCSNIAVDTITVNPKPAKPIITLSGNDLVSSTATSYQWYDADGVLQGETKKTFSPVKERVYYVVVTDKNGCVSDPSENFDYSTSVVKNVESQPLVNVFPNPVSSQFFVFADDAAFPIHYKLYESSGKEALSGKILGNEDPIKTEQLESGVYSLHLQFVHSISSHRIVVK